MPDVLTRAYAERLLLLESLKRSLEEEVAELLKNVPHVDRISFRVKGPESFLKKALDPENQPPYSEPLLEIEDQVAGRILVFFLSDIQAIVERLRTMFTLIERSRRRPARDEEFGYESEHLICLIPPHVKPPEWFTRADLPTTIELQVRTIFMHAYAEPQHDLAYKTAADLPSETRRELSWIAASAWGADQAYERVRRGREQGKTQPPIQEVP